MNHVPSVRYVMSFCALPAMEEAGREPLLDGNLHMDQNTIVRNAMEPDC
jgi:hypothetical protein